MSRSPSRRCQAPAGQQGEWAGGTAPPGVLNPEECPQFPLVLQKVLQKVEHLFPTCRRRTWFPLILEKCCVRNAFFKLLFWPQVNIWTQVWFTLGCTADCLAVFMPAAVVVRKLSCASLWVLLHQATFSHFLKQTVALISITKQM